MVSPVRQPAPMGLGAIHPIDADLYWIQGDWSVASGSRRIGCALLHTPDRIYLLGTGSGVEQRAALHAVIASFPTPQELVVISGGHQDRPGAATLVDPRLPTERHRHLTRDDLGEPALLSIGASVWTGWILDGGPLILLECSADGVGVLSAAAARAGPSGNRCTAGVGPGEWQRAALDPRVLTMLDANEVKILLVGSEAPWDRGTALRMAADHPAAASGSG